MTDPTDPTDPIDELDALASDHLDGRTTPAEAERVASDPEAAARVAALEAARAALRAEVAVDPEAREAAIAAALDAYDAERGGAATGLAPVTAPAIGRTASRRTLQLVAIAAAVILLALAVPLLAGLDGGDDAEDTAATALDEDAATEGGAGLETPAPEAAEDSAGGSPAEAYAATGLDDLGSFTDLATLEEAVRARAPGSVTRAMPSTSAAGDTADPAAPGQQTCPDELGADGTATYAATARLDDRAVLAVVRTSPAGEVRLVVLDAADCSVVATRAL